MTSSFRIAIIGGGYAGFNLARLLDAHVEVALIEAREAFVHNVAAIRATVEPQLLNQIVIPYDKLLKRGRVVRGRASAIDGGGVMLVDGRHITADAVVVATGSHYAAPFKPESDSAANFKTRMLEVSEQIASATQVIIVGAGAVGVELAGEIKAVHSDKKVVLVSDQPRLFPMYPEKLHSKLVDRLSSLGIDLHLGQAAKGLKHGSAPMEGTVKLADGMTFSGLIIPVVGARIVDSPAHDLPGTICQSNGQLAVDQWLRPSSLPHVFAIGDLAATGEGMTVVSTMRQTPWLAKTIRQLAKGITLEGLPGYARWKQPPILLPLGSKAGASVLPIGRGLVVGDKLTSAIKGKHLFIPRYHKEFGR